MIFPEHMEFRYYITPERKECYELYSMTLGCRRTLLEKTQDLGQCLVDLYDTDFYDTYCVLSEINKLLRPLTPEHKDETAWRKLLELAMPLCKVHPFFGLLIKELSDLEENHAYGKNDTKDILLRFDRDFENIVSDAKALIEVCLDDRYQPNYSTAERYREAHYDARLCFDDMRYGELATEEVMLERPAYDSAYNYSDEKLREQGIKTALREVLLSPSAAPNPQVQKLRQILCCDWQHHAGLLHTVDGRFGKDLPPNGSRGAVSEPTNEESCHKGVYTILQGSQRPCAIWNDDQGGVYRMVEGGARKARRLHCW